MRRAADHARAGAARAAVRAPGGRRPASAVLALQRTIGNRATRRLLARTPVAEKLEPFTLLYMDKFGDVTDEDGDARWRPIALDDPEFDADYVDFNIDHASVDVVMDTGEYDTIVVHYNDGRKLALPKSAIPSYTTSQHGGNVARVALVDAFVKHDENGIIFPSRSQVPQFSQQATPNLVSIRQQADAIAKELMKLRELTYITAAFAAIMASYGAVGRIKQGPGRPAAGLGLTNKTIRKPNFPTSMPHQRPTSKPAPPGGEEKPMVSMRLPEPNAPKPRQRQQQHQQPGVRIKQQQTEQQRRQAEQQAEQKRQQSQVQERQQHQQQTQQQQGQSRDARTKARDRLRYEEGAALRPQKLGRQQVDDARQAVLARPKVSAMDTSQLPANHRGAESHFRLNDPNAMSIVVKTVNEPQAVLIAGNGNWVFWRNGTVVVTPPGRPQVMLTAYGKGAKIPPRYIKRVQASDPKARVGDDEPDVSLKQLRGEEPHPVFPSIPSALLWP